MADNSAMSSPEQSAGLFNRTLATFRRVLQSGGRGLPSLRQELDPSLPPNEAERLRQQFRECLDARAGEVQARTQAAALGATYLALDDTGRRRFVDILSDDFDTDAQAIDAAIDAYRNADDGDRHQAEQGLRRSLIAPRVRLLTRFNELSLGVKFLVDLRADIRRMADPSPALRGLERDLRELLTAWFDVGFLELTHITWETPAALLEKLIEYEAVHAIRSWDDLKHRLADARRCYAFIHPCMPDEPLIFVQVALVDGLADDVHVLLDEGAPALAPESSNTAIFYSISNCQDGLAGVSFGNFLIKQVASDLGKELPNLKTFSTLSPIPGFRRWLAKMLAADTSGLLTDAQLQSLAQHAPEGTDGIEFLRQVVSSPSCLRPSGEPGPAESPAQDTTSAPVDTHPEGEQPETEGELDLAGANGESGAHDAAPEPGPQWDPDALAAVLEPILVRLCARYLLIERRGSTALDRVAHFHLTNGARVERINWMGDRSPEGLEGSLGLMVNYRYVLAEVDDNHEAYVTQGTIAAIAAVRRLLKP